MRKKSAQTGIHQFEQIALALQGGGALGAYQAGACQALAEHNIDPDWVAGVSIGAINAALIAGNPPEYRVQALEGFWRRITRFMPGHFVLPPIPLPRAIQNLLSASRNLTFGQPAFFRPRVPAPFFWADDNENALSYYDITPLKDTLIEFVDFGRINQGKVRLSVGAVNIQNGNYVYFDNQQRKIGPEHIMASGALPPGFPPVEVDGSYYWDGGLASNTPLDYIIHHKPNPDTLVFQLDLWPANGELPHNIMDVAERIKEIQYSSRTRQSSKQLVRERQLQKRIRDVLKRMPDDKDAQQLLAELQDDGVDHVTTIVHLIYKSRPYEYDSKDYTFNPQMMEEHWLAGEQDMANVLETPEILTPPPQEEGIRVIVSDKIELPEYRKKSRHTVQG